MQEKLRIINHYEDSPGRVPGASKPTLLLLPGSIEVEKLQQSDATSTTSITYKIELPLNHYAHRGAFKMQTYSLAFMAMANSVSAVVIPNVHHDRLGELFAENIQARLWRTASTQEPSLGDEHGWPQYTEGGHNNTPHLDGAVKPGTWVKFSASSWTAGFFPDSLWQIYIREKNHLHFRESSQGQPTVGQWLRVAQQWTDPLIPNSNLTDTHDLGFLAKPFESALTYNNEAKWLSVLASMSNNLAARYVPAAGVIRSWNTNNSTFTLRGSHSDSALVIIDNMMNLALLARSAAKYTGNQTHSDIARSHADKTRDHHVRRDGSSYHVCDYSATTGELYLCRTAQGLADNSTWARGQAWGIYGFAEVYSLLGDQSYLETSIKMAEWFLSYLPEDGVPFWDFDAPFITNVTPRDSSAATIAASAMILLQEQIEKHPQAVPKRRNYRDAAIKLLKDTLGLSLAGEITFADIDKEDPAGGLGANTDVSTPANTVASKGLEAILLHATANNNPQAGDGRNYDSGLVYGDFYLIEAEHRLMAWQEKHELQSASWQIEFVPAVSPQALHSFTQKRPISACEQKLLIETGHYCPLQPLHRHALHVCFKNDSSKEHPIDHIMPPTKKDSWNGPSYAKNLAHIAALSGPVQALLTPKPTNTILDIGSGDGAITTMLSKKVPQGAVVGLDSSKSMVEHATKTHTDPAKPTGNLRFIEHDCINLEGPPSEDGGLGVIPWNEGWDWVFSNSTLHWILGSSAAPKMTLPNIYRLLKPGGHFICEFGGAGHVAEAVTAFMALLAHYGIPKPRRREIMPWFFPTAHWMRSALQDAGFKVEECDLHFRPTKIENLKLWVETLGFVFLDAVEEAAPGKRDEAVEWVVNVLEDAVERSKAEGGVVLGYMRLRVRAKKLDPRHAPPLSSTRLCLENVNLNNYLSAPSQAIIAMADSQESTLLGIALELREVIYAAVLREVKVYQVKTRFIKNKQLHPFYDQWLLPVGETGITRVCRKVSSELTSRIVHDAITCGNSKIIADIQDLDFRPLQAFNQSLTEAQEQRLSASSRPKLIAVLHFSVTQALDAKKLGQWLKYQKQVNMAVTYHVGALGNGTSCAALLDSLREYCMQYGGDGEVNKVCAAVAKFQANPAAHDRQLEKWYGSSLLGNGDVVGPNAGLTESGGNAAADEDPMEVDEDDEEKAEGENEGDEDSEDDEESLDSDMMSSDDDDIE
ncbi:hypothetical protein AC579_5713 [Pseudocercospora musae]|uniref:Methyltransferase type 12 domain-containing protein n=1 Tax=Pseudocercospora musae TaxID=113226 RepID=A0A139IRS4_9PEZI|nr:hypothetical protein AC579_5713 [Pseudocercospora musae]